LTGLHGLNGCPFLFNEVVGVLPLDLVGRDEDLLGGSIIRIATATGTRVNNILMLNRGER
jgi:hypothetical protein